MVSIFRRRRRYNLADPQPDRPRAEEAVNDPASPASSTVNVASDVAGNIVQAGSIGQVHFHPASDAQFETLGHDEAVAEVALFLERQSRSTGMHLHEMVPFTLSCDGRRRTVSSLLEMWDPHSNAQLVAPSGSGKSFAVDHAVARCSTDRWLPLVVPGSYYEGDLALLLDQTVREHSGHDADVLMHAARTLDMPVVVVLDGVNECPVPLRWRLVRDLAGLATTGRAQVLLVSQDDVEVPQALAGPRLHLEPPDQEQRDALLSSYGAHGPREVYEPFTTRLELATAFRLSPDTVREAGRAGLFDAVIRQSLDQAGGSPVRAVLRVWASAMDERVSTSLPLGEAERIATRFVSSSRTEDIAVVDQARRCPLVRVRHQRLSFVHEQFGRYLAAEALVLNHSDSQELVAELRRPRHKDLGTYAIPMVPAEATGTVLLALDHPELVVDALRGFLGESVRRRARRAVEDVLHRHTAAIRSGQIVVAEEKVTTDAVLTKPDVMAFIAAALMVLHGEYWDEVLAVLDATDDAFARCYGSAADRSVDAVTWYAEILYVPAYQPAYKLAASVILRVINTNRQFRRLEARRQQLAVGRLTAVLDSLRPESIGACYLAYLLLHAAIDTDTDAVHLVPRHVRRCWTTGAHRLQVAAVDLAERAAGVIEGLARQELRSYLEHIDTDDMLLKRDLDDARWSCRGGTTRCTPSASTPAPDDDVEPDLVERGLDHILELLATPDDPDACSMAYRYHVSEGEPGHQVYAVVAERLTSDQRRAFLDMVGKGALAQPIDVTGQGDMVADYLIHIVRVCAAALEQPPTLNLAIEGPDGEAWRAYSEIIYWVNRHDLTEDQVRERCSFLWQRLSRDLPLAAPDPLHRIYEAWRQSHRDPTYLTMERVFPHEMRLLLHTGISNHTRLTSAFPLPWPQDRTDYMIQTLGRIGDEESIDVLLACADDPALGAAAVGALRDLDPR